MVPKDELVCTGSSSKWTSVSLGWMEAALPALQTQSLPMVWYTSCRIDADQTPLKAMDDCAKSLGVELPDKARQVRSQSSSLMSLRRCQETPWKAWIRARSAS